MTPDKPKQKQNRRGRPMADCTQIAMLAQVLDGDTYNAVAKKFGCTRQRVHQIVMSARKHGWEVLRKYRKTALTNNTEV